MRHRTSHRQKAHQAHAAGIAAGAGLPDPTQGRNQPALGGDQPARHPQRSRTLDRVHQPVQECHWARDAGSGGLATRLLLCLYALGTNIGLKRMSAGDHGVSYNDLLYVRRRFLQRETLRQVIAQVVNAVFAARLPSIWGEAPTACDSDSRKFGAWNQNLLTEWHVRYRGPGVMIYWHVERKSLCIYSQLKTCSSSEAAAMIEGVVRHGTEMVIEKQYVDSHGQSEVAFAFCHLLGFQLLPRLKAIPEQRLYRPDADDADAYCNLQPILTRPIDWEIIRQQYDEMIKYATALRLGTAEAEA